MTKAALLSRLCLPALLCLVYPAVADAQAQTVASAPRPPPLRLNLGRLSSPYDAAQALQAAGIARTALDRQLGRSDAKASLGFLCGLTPTPDVHGGASAFGRDREGRFLGAQLRFGFR